MHSFAFSQPRNLGVFVCVHVIDSNDPILYVSHDDEGDWTFACGRSHAETSEWKLVCLEEMVKRDPSVNDLAGMCANHSAERAERRDPWQVVDATEDEIHRLVNAGSWWIGMIGDGVPFAYTVGLWANFKHPELIIIGLPIRTAAALLNEVGDRVKGGHRFVEGEAVDDLFKLKLTARLRAFPEGAHRNYLGYALWFYRRAKFPALQVLWPDAENRIPGDAGVDVGCARDQEPDTAPRS